MVNPVIIGDATLYLGDCLEILPTLPKVDAVITSPPYNTLVPTAKPSGLHAERKRGVNVWMDKQDGYFDQMTEDDYQKWQQAVLLACLQVAPVVWINHKMRYRDGFGIHPLQFYKAPLFAEVVWDRGGSMALNCGRYAPSHEYWFGFGKPTQWNNAGNKKMSVWKIAPGAGKDADYGHPCPYPIELVMPIVESCVFDKGAIDCFMGIGSTGVACARMRRKFIGIEKDPKWHAIACDRIENAQRQSSMFDPQVPQSYEQVKLL